MPAPEELFERVANAPVVAQGLPLVILLTGFTDAGNTVSSLIDHLREHTEPQPLVVFDNDVLLDYRARRPIVQFDHDHLSAYTPARLELALAHDTFGQQFLLLTGYEPDFAWNGFTSAVLGLAQEFGVSTVSWVHAIAMPVPHTRPLGTTVSGNRSELIAAHSIWKPRTQVPATVGHVLEYRFAEQEMPVVGFVMLVPHYLAETSYPDAVLAAADRLMTATGRVLDMDSVRAESAEYLARVESQVQGNDELLQMLHTLEERHDSYMAGYNSADPAHGFGDAPFSERNLPSADELAAELERYLASRPPGDDEDKTHRLS